MHRDWYIRVRAWWEEVEAKLRKKWWLWPILLGIDLVHHWFSGTIVDYLRSHSGGALSFLKAIALYLLGSPIALAVFGSLVILLSLAIHAYFDVRRRPTAPSAELSPLGAQPTISETSITIDQMRAQVAAADAELAEVEDRAWRQQRERERPEVERFREIYPQVDRAVTYATEYVVADLLLAPSQGDEAHMLIFNLLRAWAVAPCQTGERLALDLVAPDVAPLDTIMADLKDLLTKYGLLVAYIERAGRIVLGPRRFYESEGYAGLWQRHRECIAELRKISLRSAFRSIASHLAPLADLLASQPLTPAEVARRHVIMVDLRKLYISTRPDVEPEIFAGTAWPPTDWMNAKLEQAGELWRL
jgi:hypothetical protein